MTACLTIYLSGIFVATIAIWVSDFDDDTSFWWLLLLMLAWPLVLPTALVSKMRVRLTMFMMLRSGRRAARKRGER